MKAFYTFLIKFMKLGGKVRKNILRAVVNSFGEGLAWHSNYIFSKCVRFSPSL